MSRLLPGLFLLVFATAAFAARIQNGGFEHGSVLNTCNVFDLPAGSTVIAGWTVSAGTIDWEGPPPCGWQASRGRNSLDLVGQACIGGIRQTFATIAGKRYTLSFDMAGNYGAPPAVKPLDVTINGVTTHFTFDTTGKGQFNMGWVRHRIVFDATSSSTTVNFVSDVTASGAPCNAGAAIDNVRVSHGFFPHGVAP